MKTILLACSAGMSTSLLVTKMQKSAQEKGIEAKIFAVSVSEVEATVESEPIDVLLLGPQVQYLKDELTGKMAPKGIPVEVINMMDYGMMNGEKVLETALQIIEK